MRLLQLFLGTAFLVLLPSSLFAQARAPQKEDKGAVKEMPVKEPEFDSTPDDQKLLRDMGLGLDGPALLEYFKKRTFKEADPKRVDSLIKNLGAEEFDVREKAYTELLAMGSSALVGLKQAENHPDNEVKRRAGELRQAIEAKAEPQVQAATARLIAKGKPEGAADVLLAYLPFAADQSVIDEISKALGAVALRNGKPEAVIVQSLKDKHPVKRGAAAEALARAKVASQVPALRELLKDANPSVRLRIAMALVEFQKEKDAVPVLIETLGHLPPEQLWPAEEILVRLAGDQTPSVSLGTNEISRKNAQQAWSKWYEKHKKGLDLAKLDAPQTLLGYTLVVQQGLRIVNGRRAMGEVLELKAGDKEPRWRFEVPTYPVDAQVIGQDRVLIAEYQGGRVTERDFKGNVVWEKAVGGNPIGVQRLANGNTFIVMQNRLVELDRQGKEAFTLQRQNHDIFRARKLKNGEVVFVTNQGMLTRIEGKTQREVKSFNVGQIPVLFGSIDVLPNGGALVPQFHNNQVTEFDANGKEVARFPIQFPNSAQRLPNGHTLVASQQARRIVEFDRNGQEVWSHMTDGMVFNARRR
jgi:hypothetical protein